MSYPHRTIRVLWVKDGFSENTRMFSKEGGMGITNLWLVISKTQPTLVYSKYNSKSSLMKIVRPNPDSAAQI
jgi:hypothetical protein